MSWACIVFFIDKKSLNSPNYWIRTRLWFTNFTKQSELTECFCRFIQNLHCNIMNKLCIHIFQWFINIFHMKYKSPMYNMVVLFMFILIWLCPLLLTVAIACPVRPANRHHLVEQKCKLIFKKLLKNLTTILYGSLLLSVEQIVILKF